MVSSKMFSKYSLHVVCIIVSLVTSQQAACPGGFVQCDDGSCEPFITDCGDSGGAQLTSTSSVLSSGTPSPPVTPIVTDTTPTIPDYTATMIVTHSATDGGPLSSTASPASSSAIPSSYVTSIVTDSTSNIPDSRATMIVTNMVTDAITSSTTSSNVRCPAGFIVCDDGTCEPFESNCAETGLATITFPTADPAMTSTTQSSSSNIVSMATKDKTDSSTFSLSKETMTAASTEQTSYTSTRAMYSSTTNKPIVTNNIVTAVGGSCADGWEKCKDGTCEPFHWLCTEHDGSPHFTTRPPHSTNSTTKMPPIFTAAPTADTVTSPSPSSTTTTASAPVTSNNGQCPSGFIVCEDGTCEPFESNCAETGLATGTFPTLDPTMSATTGSPSRNTVSLVTNGMTTVSFTSDFMPTSTTTQIMSTSTTTKAVVTDANGKQVCSDGWEQCNDGTCEPFHWLCTEHDASTGTALVG